MIAWVLTLVLLAAQGEPPNSANDAAAAQWAQLIALRNAALRITRELPADDPSIAATVQELISAHQRFLRSFPEHSKAWSALGRLAVDANDMVLADQAFSAATVLDHDDTASRIAWATAWMHRDPARGIEVFDRHINASPDSLVLHSNRLRALALHDPDGVQQRFDALLADPNGTVAAATMLEAMSQLELPGTEAHLAALMAASTGHPAVLTVQARIERAKNNFGRARAAMEAIDAAARVDPRKRYLYSDTCYAEHDFDTAWAEMEAIDAELLSAQFPGLARRLRFLIPLRRRLAETWPAEQQRRLADARDGDTPLVVLVIDGQEVICELHGDAAPNTTAAFLNLVDSGFHDGRPAAFVHIGFRSIFGERDDSDADPPWTLAAEFERPEQRPHLSGILNMYRHASRPDSADTRFTISHFPTPHLDGARTAFGRVISGIDVIRSMQGDEKVDSIHILRRGAPLPAPVVLDGNGTPMQLRDLSDPGG